MRNNLRFSRVRRRTTPVLVVTLIVAAALLPRVAIAENFFDFLFGGAPPKQQQRAAPQQQPQSNAFADPFGLFSAPAPPKVASSGGRGGSGHCVRLCDGKYFPVLGRGGVSPSQMCQAFCPASATKVFFGGSIDHATTSGGERYADLDNAFAYRKALKPDCTCNGRDPAGLAPVDLSFDSTLRAGDVVATANGLMAYSGIRLGQNQSAEFTPVASFPGLTAEVRARLGELKVAPVTAEIAEDGTTVIPETATMVAQPVTVAPKATPSRGKRADIN